MIAKEIRLLLRGAVQRSGPQPWTPVLPADISNAKLPITGEHLFGRKLEMDLLDGAWADEGAHVLSLVAWGGVGKSALVNHWLGGMGRDHFRGARRVYGWSFYSQGSRETAASADLFMDAALRWFGDADSTAGSPWDKGERLARLVRQERTLLILDGVEPLQNPPGPDGGRIRDPALAALVRELATANPGLCVITTRHRVADVEHLSRSTAPVIELEHLSDAAGAELLRALGVQGPEEELRQASREFGGHGLALNLLGAYLRDVFAGDVRCRSEVRLLEEDEEQGGHARRVMTSYERWFGDGPELAVLRMIGLFDRPAGRELIDVLRAPPTIPGFTDSLFHSRRPSGFLGLFRPKEATPLSDFEWRQALARLRWARLLTEADPHDPDTLDAHPLVREHFGQQLREMYPDAWREGNNRLYEHLKRTTKELPDTVEEMAPLYAAVVHGCRAGRHREVYDEVYRRRIQRRDEFFSINKLGAFGADLTALSGFFDPPWRKPVTGLTEDRKSFVLNEAGFCLRALGRLTEAAQPLQAGLEADFALEDWNNAARSANNLSELYLTIGDPAKALEYARQGVDLADRSGDAFQRMVMRTVLADALHQAGRLTEAEAAFREAEEMQKKKQPEYPMLYSFQGFLYCDLLLGQGKYREVRSRASQTIEIAKRNN